MEPFDPPTRASALRDARAELGLGPDASSPDVRAAYLRLLKTRKPEVDPDGFRRLRAAYELLSRAQSELAPEQRLAEAAPSRADVPLPAPVAPPADPGATEAPAPIDARQSLEAGARRMAAAYAAARTHPEIGVPPPALALDAMLRLHEVGASDVAHALGRALQGWLDAVGGESRYLRDWAAAVWGVLRDLAVLPETVPPELVVAVARATREGDLAGARDAFMAYRGRSPGEAERLAAFLRASAPVLSAALGSYLVYAPAPVRATRSYRWVFPVMFCLNVLRLACTSAASLPSKSTSFAPPDESVQEKHHAIFRALDGLSRAVEAGDCAAIEADASRVSKAMNDPDVRPSEDERARAGQLARRRKALCTETENGSAQ